MTTLDQLIIQIMDLSSWEFKLISLTTIILADTDIVTIGNGITLNRYNIEQPIQLNSRKCC